MFKSKTLTPKVSFGGVTGKGEPNYSPHPSRQDTEKQGAADVAPASAPSVLPGVPGGHRWPGCMRSVSEELRDGTQALPR